MAENSNQEEATVTQLGGGGEGYGSNHFIYMETLFGRWGGRGGSMRKGGIY